MECITSVSKRQWLWSAWWRFIWQNQTIQCDRVSSEKTNYLYVSWSEAQFSLNQPCCFVLSFVSFFPALHFVPHLCLMHCLFRSCQAKSWESSLELLENLVNNLMSGKLKLCARITVWHHFCGVGVYPCVFQHRFKIFLKTLFLGVLCSCVTSVYVCCWLVCFVISPLPQSFHTRVMIRLLVWAQISCLTDFWIISGGCEL